MREPPALLCGFTIAEFTRDGPCSPMPSKASWRPRRRDRDARTGSEADHLDQDIVVEHAADHARADALTSVAQRIMVSAVAKWSAPVTMCDTEAADHSDKPASRRKGR